MRGTTRATFAAGIASLALVAGACGGGGTPTPATSEGGKTGGEIVVAGCTPQNPLVPGNTSETCGGDIIDAMTAKLVALQHRERRSRERHRRVDRDHRQQELHRQAEAGYKFQDGTEVKAKNFVDAWNYTAYGPNGSGGQLLLSGPIAGYERRAVPPTTTDCKARRRRPRPCPA